MRTQVALYDAAPARVPVARDMFAFSLLGKEASFPYRDSAPCCCGSL
jgi:hypothetical protein